MGRKIRDREDAGRCLSAWEASGEALGSWARQHGIDGRSLQCWKRNIGWQPQRQGVVELVPVGQRPVTLATYVVRLDGVEVEVGDNFNGDTLLRLLRVVASC